MYRLLSFVAPAAFLVLTGCDCIPLTVSLNPLVGDKEAVSEPTIVGTWQSTDGSSRMVIRVTGPAEYEIVEPRNDPKDEQSCRMRLIRINGELLADMSPKNVGDQLLREHSIFRIRVAGDRRHLALFGGEWLRNEITRPGGPAYAALDDEACDLVLTGSTAELQTFVGRYVYASQAFDDDDGEYRRVTDGEKQE